MAAAAAVEQLRQPPDIDKYLTQRYYDIKQPAAFTSVQKLYDVIRREGKYNIPLKRIEEWGRTQDAITLNKRPIYKGRVQRKVVTGLMNSIWDIDLMVLNQERYKIANDGYAYVIVCVDILSRFGRVAAIKSKGSQDVIKGFKEIFAKVKTLPRSTRQDNGKEFTAFHVKQYFKELGINQYFTNSSSKANYSEILIKNLKRRLFRLFQYRNSYRYTDILDDLLKSYNETHHSSLGMSPSDVTTANQEDVWFRMYFPPTAYKRAFQKARHLTTRHVRKPRDPFKYDVGDTVRVSYLKDTFMRDFEERYSGEVFTITAKRLDQGIPIYFLKDYSGDKVDGAFYERDIQKIVFDPDQSFKIDKVLKTRKRKGVDESLVTFASWPKKYASWIPTNTIEQL